MFLNNYVVFSGKFDLVDNANNLDTKLPNIIKHDHNKIPLNTVKLELKGNCIMSSKYKRLCYLLYLNLNHVLLVR